MAKSKFIEYNSMTTPDEIAILSDTRDSNTDESSRYAVSLLKTSMFDDAYLYEVMCNHELGTIEIKDSEGYRTSFDIISNQRSFINFMEIQSRNQLITGEMSQIFIDETPYPVVLNTDINKINLNLSLIDKKINRCIIQPNLLVYKMVKDTKQMIDVSGEATITIDYTVGSANTSKSVTRPYNSAGKPLKILKGSTLNTLKSITINLPELSDVGQKYLIIINDIIISYNITT